MRIDEMLYQLHREIEKQFNIRNPVLKITLTHEAFDAMVFEMAKVTDYRANYTPSWMNDFVICGVKIEARMKENI